MFSNFKLLKSIVMETVYKVKLLGYYVHSDWDISTLLFTELRDYEMNDLVKRRKAKKWSRPILRCHPNPQPEGKSETVT